MTVRRRDCTRILAATPLALLPFRVAEGQTEENSSDVLRLSVSMELVVLYATARDHQGRLVPGLGKGDFEVFEEGVPQAVRVFSREDVPVTVGLVVDHSGSMHQRMPSVITAASTFARSSNSQDEMFVVNFNENVRMGLAESKPFTSDADILQEALRDAPVAGRTALYDAMGVALDRINKGTREKKVLVVISDGGDNASKSATLPGIMDALARSGVIVYTIGLFDATNDDANPAVLKKLAQFSGGEVYLPDDIRDVPKVCGEIAQGIRAQYVLGYVSTNAQRPGEWRGVRVNAHQGRKNLAVRTRLGYTVNRAGGTGK